MITYYTLVKTKFSCFKIRKSEIEFFVLVNFHGIVPVSLVIFLKVFFASYGSWMYNYLCNQCISPLKLWVPIPFMARCTRYKIMFVCDLRQVSDILQVLRFPPPIKLTARNNRNIVESGVKHHNHNPSITYKCVHRPICPV